MSIRINKETVISIEFIRKALELFMKVDLPRLNKLEQYYLGHNDILKRVMEDPTKPNNKIVNPYASYITDTLTGYFMGEPVTYTCQNSALLENLTQLFEYNDEADENMELAKNASIFGVAYELLYTDEEGKTRFASLDPKCCIPIYDDTVTEDLLAVIRFYKSPNIVTNEVTTMIEVYTAREVSTYRTNENMSTFQVLDIRPHFFKMVPVAVFKNNNEMLGDFERVISLIDAYDQMESDGLNDYEYFVDSYLALYGFTAEPEDVLKMKQNRVLLMDEGTSAEWLIKNENDAHIENSKNRLDADIHKFAKCPNLSDKEFASNASGIAIKFKLLGTENLASVKERKFKRGLQMRLELISHIAGLLDQAFDWRDIDIIFTRNIPTNDTDIAAMVKSLDGIVSRETLLAQLPFVEDIQTEIKRLDAAESTNSFYQTGLNYLTSAMKNSGVTEEDNETAQK